MDARHVTPIFPEAKVIGRTFDGVEIHEPFRLQFTLASFTFGLTGFLLEREWNEDAEGRRRRYFVLHCGLFQVQSGWLFGHDEFGAPEFDDWYGDPNA